MQQERWHLLGYLVQNILAVVWPLGQQYILEGLQEPTQQQNNKIEIVEKL